MKKTYTEHLKDNKLHLIMLVPLALTIACIIMNELIGAIFFFIVTGMFFIGNFISWKAYLKNTNRNQDGSLKK